MNKMSLIVSMVMFVFYVAILLGVLKKLALRRSGHVFLIAQAGLEFGILSYALIIAPLNSIEAYFMDNRGFFHVLFVGPIQEEIAKFACFIFAYFFITRWSDLSELELSEIGKSENLVILGVFVGLTFALLESIIDYWDITIEAALIRAFISWPVHMITTAISVYGFYKYRITQRDIIIPCTLVLAITIHTAFNMAMILLHRFWP